jgi:hypothetical protein
MTQQLKLRHSITTFIALAISAVSASALAGPSLELNAGAWRAYDAKHPLDQGYHTASATDNGTIDSGGNQVVPYTVSSAASGMASGGVMKSSTSASYTTGPLAASSLSFGQWADYIRVESAGLATGTTVQVHYSFQLDTDLLLSYTPRNGFGGGAYSLGWTEWRFQHYISGNGNSTIGERQDILSDGSYVTAPQPGFQLPSPDGRVELVANFAIGSPMYMYTGLLAQTFVGDGRGIASVNAGASSSLYWGGIDLVTLADGRKVDFSVFSDSGTDYARSYAPAAQVPEPGTLALFAVAGALMTLAARRRRSVDSSRQ